MANYFAITSTIPQVISQLEHESATLLNWIRNTGLEANPDKFHLLLSDPSKELSTKVDNLEIKNLKCPKLFGI